MFNFTSYVEIASDICFDELKPFLFNCRACFDSHLPQNYVILRCK